ncbi:MAG: 50S ribosomal protein L24 [Planctomycetaceae bacterium]|jgi:large subunit ribosomal protein L24|nr:50S ribosomal protein L24 [Planctomycetaceae bacterium]
MKLKIDDNVEVRIGAQAGKRGRIKSIDREKNRVVIEGVNVLKKHVRRSQRNPQGGILSKEMPIPVSNVMIICPTCQKITRIGIRLKPEGGKQRICKKCGSMISEITTAKKNTSAK